MKTKKEQGKSIPLQERTGRPGRPKGSQSPILAPWKRAMMFEAWFEKGSRKYVADTCSVALGTVDKYRDFDEWDAKIERMRQQTALANPKETNLKAATEGALRMLRIIRMKAMDAVLRLEFKSAKDAFNAFDRALERELDLHGHMSPKDAGLLAILAERYQLATAKGTEKSKDVTNKAQVETVGE